VTCSTERREACRLTEAGEAVSFPALLQALWPDREAMGRAGSHRDKRRPSHSHQYIAVRGAADGRPLVFEYLRRYPDMTVETIVTEGRLVDIVRLWVRLRRRLAERVPRT